MSVAPANINVRFKSLAVHWIAVVLPTAALLYAILQWLNFSLTEFDTKVTQQFIYAALGLLCGYTLYFFRARVLTTLLLLWIVYQVADGFISSMHGEFDVFYALVRFRLYGTLYLIGWSIGLVIQRWKWGYLLFAISIAVVALVVVSDTYDLSFAYIVQHLLPVLIYVLYMLMIMPRLKDAGAGDARKVMRSLLKVVVVIALMLGIFYLVTQTFSDEIKAVEREITERGKSDDKGNQGPKGYNEKNGLMERGNKPHQGGDGQNNNDGENGYRMKDSMKMDDRMSQHDQLMFCARINNFFPDGTPKPLYFVYHYLTQYDTQKEQFTRDPNMPYFDEFNVDPSTIPMYRTRVDSTPIKNGLGNKLRSVVDAEVYFTSTTWKHALLGPAGSFFCQTIPVDTSYGKMFTSGYRVKAWASDLNNAYFVYNPTANEALDDFQQERFDELRSVESYAGLDTHFYNYYTRYPQGTLFDSIKNLANRIAAGAKTPADKVLAVRNYFMAKDDAGNPIFKYTLNPGKEDKQNIPNATMLGRFLFKTKAGYCTYYAGASVFMLRALGIPVRFTTGFATVDRSDKNKGWYWFYGSQAHAWTQVYFPDYGWLDFDVTVTNSDRQDAPRPDGTPPIPPPQPWLVARGVITSDPDTKAKSFEFTFDDLNFYNEAFRTSQPYSFGVDASVCRIIYGKADTTFAALHKGDTVTVVSYIDAAKQVPDFVKGKHIDLQVREFPNPLIIDEVHIDAVEKEDAKKEDQVKSKNEKTVIDWMAWINRLAWVLIGLIVIGWLLPLIIFGFMMMRVSRSGNGSELLERVYRLVLYVYHMQGFVRRDETVLKYAQFTMKPIAGDRFENFVRLYLAVKFSSHQLSNEESQDIKQFATMYAAPVKQLYGSFKYFINFLNPISALRYFRSKKSNPHDES